MPSILRARTPRAEPLTPLVAFYGDSYTLGTGASDPSKRRSSIIAADRGWREVNFAYEQAGEQIRDAMIADYDRLVAGLPDTRIIVVEPFWYTDERPAFVDIIGGWQREQAERMDAELDRLGL